MPLAAVMPAPGAPLELREIARPRLDPGAALLDTIASEVCGTDVHLHHGKLAGVPYPIIPGHVSVGRIAALGSALNDVHGQPFEEGDIVTFLDVHGSCGNCYHCLVTKQSTRCPHRRVYGITLSANQGLLGGWAEQLWLMPGTKLIRLPSGLDPETFIGGGCGLVTAVAALERAEVKLGATVAVLGVGPVGQSAIALAALSGAERVIAIGDPSSRLDVARRMGATEVIGLDVPHNERVARVKDLTSGYGVDIVIEAAGAAPTVSQGLDLVRDGGRVVVCGHYTDNGAVPIHPHWQINRKHVEIRGSWGCDFSHFDRAVRLAARFGDRIPWREMVSRRYRLDQANEALAAVEQMQLTKACITP